MVVSLDNPQVATFPLGYTDLIIWLTGGSFMKRIYLILLFALPLLACNLTAVSPKTSDNSSSTIPTAKPIINAPLPTASAELIEPTAVPTTTPPTEVNEPTPTTSPQSTCTIRSEWPVYIVQAGDTVFNIGRRVGLTVAELATANCLPNAQLIAIGQQLHVPHVPIEIVPTETPLPTATAVSPQLISFDVSPRTVNSNEPTVISWQSSGSESVYLYTRHHLLRFGGDFLNNGRPLPPTGSFTYTAPSPLTQISYAITFLPDESHLLQTITVNINCIYDFFLEPGDNVDACPTTDVQMREAAYQPFERGFMVWQPGKIWVFSNNTPSSNELQDLWQGEPILFDEEPPQGLFLPQRGFGKVWVENAWIRHELGWATAVEQGYTMEYQETATGLGVYHYFVSLADGRTIRVMLFHGTTLRWQPAPRHE